MVENQNTREEVIDKMLEKILQVISKNPKPAQTTEQNCLSIRDKFRIQARKKLVPKIEEK